MSLDERIQQLDEGIASRFKDWARDLQGQLGQTLNDEIARQLEVATSQVPENLMDPGELGSITAAASSFGGEKVLRNLHSAVVGIDRSAKQADILQALVEGAGAFASRSAIFLTRADQASGWSAAGFGDGDAAIPGLVVEYQDAGPWHRLSLGRSSIRLSTADCGELCSRIEAPLPQDGVLIPLVLRDRVAAALYADRLQGDPGGLGIGGLQLLAYIAAQAIESLPFRHRTSTTPTLLLSDEEEEEQEGLGLWGGAVSVAAAAAAAVASDATAESSDTESSDGESSSTEFEAELESAELESDELEAEVEPEAEVEVELELEDDEALEVPDEPAMDETPAYTDTQALQFQQPADEDEGDSNDVSASSWEEPEASSPETGRGVGLAWTEDDEVAEPVIEPDDAWAVEVAPEAEGSEPGSLWEVEEDEVELEAEPELLKTEELEPSVFGDEALEESLREEPVIEAAALEPAPAPSWEVVEEPSTVQSFAGHPGLETIQAPVMPSMTETSSLEDDATMFLPTPVAPSAPWEEPPAEEAEGDETHPGIDSVPESAPEPEPAVSPKPGRASEVQPPADVQGPGWAFSKEAVKVNDDDEDHKQAKRLARLLVSEIKLYNEEQVEQGQKNNDIYQRLKEDIDRSRQVYEDRVNERVRSTNDYFYQELVRTLAAGDPQALGI